MKREPRMLDIVPPGPAHPQRQTIGARLLALVVLVAPAIGLLLIAICVGAARVAVESVVR